MQHQTSEDAGRTSRWDYDYTGGDALGAPMDTLADKRVAVIGTGATAVQCVPELAKYCRELYVVQRTPSAVDERGNHPIDEKWFAQIATPGWQKRWLDSFTTIWDGVLTDPSELAIEHEDLVRDGWTALGQRMRAAVKSVPIEHYSPENVQRALEDADDEQMERIRARVDEIVTNPATAEQLKAWFRQMCKRPCFRDDYLPAFNRPNTPRRHRRQGGWSASPNTAWSSPAWSTRSTASSTPSGSSSSAPATPTVPDSTRPDATGSRCPSIGRRAHEPCTACTPTDSPTYSCSS
ncbi:hypothetical protein [Rhodococcus sp. PSBB066]|uniref:hypothetical protein n=1 Tax=Rhodococcus sp. PSBB066 TaxID=2812864 RepID=UPI00197EE769|nr:hypothetical protein [Rhodococcus sp. PSBB066]QSE60096.1 hypothetical protein JYA75_03595 [Rhodococcus sp. PSBB066]